MYLLIYYKLLRVINKNDVVTLSKWMKFYILDKNSRVLIPSA